MENGNLEQGEVKTVEEDLFYHIGHSSTNLEDLEKGSKERQVESCIYEQQFNAALAYDKQRFNKEIELQKLEIEREKAKTEKIQGWTKVGLRVLEVGAFVTMGWLKLKENMLQGAESGKDAEGWWRELLKK